MSLTLDGTATAAAGASARGVAWLVDLHFTGGLQSVTTWGREVPANGRTYTALGTLAEVAAVQESADTTGERLKLSLSIVNSAMFAAAMGDPATYRGRRAQLWLQLFDAGTLQPAGAPVLRWQGYMDKLSIERQPGGPDTNGSHGRIQLECSRAGLARARRAEGLRHTDAQQQQRYPGDTGLRYVRTLIEKPSLWLSKKFQEV
jgi:hypothetical protein